MLCDFVADRTAVDSPKMISLVALDGFNANDESTWNSLGVQFLCEREFHIQSDVLRLRDSRLFLQQFGLFLHQQYRVLRCLNVLLDFELWLRVLARFAENGLYCSCFL